MIRLNLGLSCLLVFGLVTVIGTPTPAGAAKAGVKEVRLNLAKYCKARKRTYTGYSKKSKKHHCAAQRMGFNTIYYTNHRPINLTSVCRRTHKTDKWRFVGDKVWCLVNRGAKLTLCNRRNEKIWTAIGYYVKGGRRTRHKGWVSEGWWSVAPGKCNTIWNNQAYRGDIYVHAINSKGELPANDARLCVLKGKAFKFGNSDKTCQGTNRKKVGMSKFAVKSGNNRWNVR